MSNVTIETDQPATTHQPNEPERKRTKTAQARKPAKAGKRAKAAKAAKKTAQKSAAKPIQKAAHKPAAERSNKKAEVIAMMTRPKGATLDEIVSATGWQKHTVRGFVSVLGKKGEARVESSKNPSGERTYKITK